MERNKTRLVRITNDSARRASLKKRTFVLLKSELSIPCSVQHSIVTSVITKEMKTSRVSQLMEAQHNANTQLTDQGRDLSENKRTKKDKSFDQEFKGGNESLRLSCKNAYPLRVIRSYKDKHSSFAPVKGLRYDGIYIVKMVAICWRVTFVAYGYWKFRSRGK